MRAFYCLGAKNQEPHCIRGLRFSYGDTQIVCPRLEDSILTTIQLSGVAPEPAENPVLATVHQDLTFFLGSFFVGLSIDFVMGTDIKKDNLFFRYHKSQSYPVAIGKTNCV